MNDGQAGGINRESAGVVMKMVGVAVLVFCMTVVMACAQWVQESVNLKPGWNAVFVTVAPEPANCDSLFADCPDIESVWRWNKRFSPIDFDLDPAEPFRDAEAWLRWYPADHPYRSLRNLHAYQGGVAHLIRVRTNAAPFTWQVTGTPQLPASDWFEYQINLMGMTVDEANAPSFNEYFADVEEIGVLPDVDLGEIYEVNVQAGGDQVVQPARSLIERNKAYWILCQDKTDYAGPLKISVSPGSGMLNFGTDGVEGALSISNVLTNRPVSVRVERVASAIPPAGQPVNAGMPPLGCFVAAGTNAAEWQAWSGALEQTIGPNQTWTLPVCVWRSEIMTNAPGVCQCLLDIKELDGLVHCYVPVRAEVKAVE